MVIEYSIMEFNTVFVCLTFDSQNIALIVYTNLLRTFQVFQHAGGRIFKIGQCLMKMFIH